MGAEILVPRRSQWQFFSSDNDEGTSWRAFGTDESAPTDQHLLSRWRTGVAPFGWGIAAIGTAPWKVPGRYSTDPLYFRREFEVTDPARFSALKIRLLREGGAVVYLNDEEVVRDNLAADATHETPSANTERVSRCAYYVFTIEPTTLRQGNNVIAVEIHQENDPKLGELVQLSFFASLSIEQTAELLEISPRSVARHWNFARAWLAKAIEEMQE